jgi:hypothetical protein
MNQERQDFKSTPIYDDFLEMREDLINRFIELYDTTGATVGAGAATREELEKILHKFEIENQERIIHSRSTAEDRKRRKIESIIETEGTMFDRINVDYKDRDSVIDHELAVQYSELLSRKGDSDSKFNHHASADLINRKTRLIHQPSNTVSQLSVPVIAEASGCRDLWKSRALSVIKNSFNLIV